jgi:hypothetical protein
MSQMFAILFSEPAGANALNEVTHYNNALSLVRYNEFAHTQIRRFIIVRRRTGHCYAMYVCKSVRPETLLTPVAPSLHMEIGVLQSPVLLQMSMLLHTHMAGCRS